METRQHNWKLDGSDIPLAVGDRQYAQDKLRDFWHLKEYASKILEDLLSDYANNIIITGCIGSQGAGHTLSWTAGRVKVLHTVKTPTDWSALPPPMTSHTISITIDIPTMTNQSITGATTDGITVNYAKFTYNESGTSNRQRAKKAGTYDSEINPTYTYTCNSTVPTVDEVAFATFTSDGATLTFTNQEYRWNPGIFFKYEETTNDIILKTNKRYIATGENKNLTLPTIANIGDTINIFSEKMNKIIQPDSENLISHFDQYFTTKGTSGYLLIPNKNSVKLIYKGINNSMILPGTKITNPADLPAGLGYCCTFSYDGVYLVVGHVNSPYMTIYKRSGDTFTKLDNPATLPATNVISCAFSYDGTYLAVGSETGGIAIYKRSGDTFTKLTVDAPDIVPTGEINDIAFSYDGTYLAMGTAGTPYIWIYKRLGDTFIKLTNPSTLPTGYVYGVAFSYDGLFLACTHGTSLFMTVYQRAGDVFTKITNPSILPSNTGISCAFSYDGRFLAIGHQNTPFISIYKVNINVEPILTKIANPSILPTTSVTDVKFSYDGNYLICSTQSSPFIIIYRISGDIFTKIVNPAILPPAACGSCDIIYDSSYTAIVHGTSPFVTIYKNLVTANKTWFLEQLNTLFGSEEKQLLFK